VHAAPIRDFHPRRSPIARQATLVEHGLCPLDRDRRSLPRDDRRPP
jgi:hypothetical protein